MIRVLVLCVLVTLQALTSASQGKSPIPLLKTKLAQAVKPKCCVCYAVDDSGSINIAEWMIELNLVKVVTLWNNVFRPGSCYSACAFTTLQFVMSQEIASIPDFFQNIMDYERNPGGTELFEGLNCCKARFKPECTSRSIVLLSDGADFSPATTSAAATAIKNMGISIVTVGVAPVTPANRVRLQDIASDKTCYFETTFNKLRKLPVVGPKPGPQPPRKKVAFAKKIAAKLCPTPPALPCCVCYALDQSGSINDEEWNLLRNYVQSLSTLQTAMSPNTIYSACTFNTAAINVQSGTTNVATLVGSIPVSPSGGGTFIGSGLRCCKASLEKLKCATKTIVLLSDGFDGNAAGTQAIADSIKSMGVRIISVMIGNGNKKFLKKISTNKKCVIKTTFPRLRRLNKKKVLKEVKKAKEKLCVPVEK